MEAGKKTWIDYISGKKIFNVPIFQRKYNWSVSECKQLYDDLLAVGKDENRNTYFMGTFVAKEEANNLTSDFTELTLIDGQQRLTSITLLYCAICNYLKNKNKEKCHDIYTDYIVNSDMNKTIKLRLTEKDNSSLKYVINSIRTGNELKLNSDTSINIYNNYRFFKNKINDNTINPILMGLRKLVIISVTLDHDDNPQLIFESLNSTGLELNQNDLIRNYILMGQELPEQNYLYQNYWYELEKGFNNEDKLFDDFIRFYLIIRNNGNNITKKKVYKEFKSLADSYEKIEDLLKDILKFANYFFNIKFEKEDDPELLAAFQSFNKLNINMPLTFLLEAYDDYKNSENNPEINLNKEEFIKIVNFVESYCLRRAMCGMDTKTLNYTFARLTREINKKDYFNYFVAAMLSKTDNKTFPTDSELKETLITQNMFSKDSIRYILDTLEVAGKEKLNDKQIIDLDNCSIEHIMPQTLSKEWKRDLGENWKEIHEIYLDTLGNLTLTQYNPEYSNKTFIEKKTLPEKGFNDSKLYLNNELKKLDSWGKNEIINRAKNISDDIINIWEYPVETEEITEIMEFIKSSPGDVEEHTLDEFDNLEEKSHPRQLFDALNILILKLDSDIKQSILKQYIAYKKNKNFVEIVPQKRRLQLSLDIPLSDLNDPKGICEDVSYKGRWGTGVTRTYLKNEQDVNYIIDLIKQSYEYNLE